MCPVKLRPYLTTYVNLCWVIGQLIASGVLTGLLSRTDQWVSVMTIDQLPHSLIPCAELPRSFCYTMDLASTLDYWVRLRTGVSM